MRLNVTLGLGWGSLPEPRRLHVGAAALTLALALVVPPAAAQEDKNVFERVFDSVVGGLNEGTGLERAKKNPPLPETDAYGNALYGKYLELSVAEWNEGDYADSDVFAERAIAAGQGQRNEPENIKARDLPASALNEAASSRRRLVSAQVRGARDKAPVDAAEAQAAFDCWMQEQEEDFQYDDIAACRQRFAAAMANIDEALKEQVTFLPPPAARVTFDVFFDFDSDVLSPEAKLNVSQTRDVIGGFRNPVISVIGNADQVGATDYNLELSQRRADAVAAEIRALGFEVDGVFARGDQAPAVDRPDRGPERMNRRVIIVVREGN